MKAQKDFGFDEAEDSPGFLFWQVTTLWQRGIKKALDAIDITHSQFVIMASLLWLSGQKAEVTQIDLSHHSKIDAMTTSTIIRTLEKKNLVNRKKHSTDTRAKTICLTHTGMQVTRNAIKIIEEFDDRFFKKPGISSSAFNVMLRKLIKQ